MGFISELETKRLILRPTVLSDADEIQNYFNNWEIIKWMRPPVPWPYPPDSAKQYLQGLQNKPSYRSFAIRRKDEEKVLGTIRFECHESEGLIYAERGFTLDQNYWGQGLMSESADAINDFIFTTTAATEIRACNAIGNTPSRRIKQKQGFLLKGIFDSDPPYHCGEKQEERWFLPKEIWLKIRSEQ